MVMALISYKVMRMYNERLRVPKAKSTPVFESGTMPSNDPPFIVPVYPIVYEDHPYAPPLQKPQTREEAIFLLAYCGFNALEVPAHLIRAFSNVFCYREHIQKSGHCIINIQDVPEHKWVRKNTNTLVKRWIKKKPAFFSGLPKLAGWLQHACCLSGLPDGFFLRCTQEREYESISRAAYDELSSPSLEKLAEELYEIAYSCNRLWTFHGSLKLILQYAELVEKSNAPCASDLTLKKQLHEKLKKNRFYLSYIPDFLDGTLDEWERNKDADMYINGIREALENADITFSSIIDQIQNILGQQPCAPIKAMAAEFTSNINRQIDSPVDAPHEAAGLGSNQGVNCFLRSDRHFSLEFFIWFCIAYVEVNLASASDHEATPKKATNWLIYLKMRELNDGKDIDPVGRDPKKTEKEKKAQVGNLITHCKGRLRENGLPVHRRNSAPDKNEIIQCIVFFQKIPEIIKYSTRAKFMQEIINKGDVKQTEY